MSLGKRKYDELVSNGLSRPYTDTDSDTDADNVTDILFDRNVIMRETDSIESNIYEIKNWFDLYFDKEKELHETNCVYLTLSIYHNVISHGFEDHEKIKCHYNIPGTNLGIVFKIGSTGTPNSSVYSRLKQELAKKSCIFTIPVLVMKGCNTRSIESDILNKLKPVKLKLGIINQCKLSRPTEFFSPSDEIKDYILEVCEDNGLDCIYNFNPKAGQDWFDAIPRAVKKKIDEIFDKQELVLMETSDNLSKTERTELNENGWLI